MFISGNMRVRFNAYASTAALIKAIRWLCRPECGRYVMNLSSSLNSGDDGSSNFCCRCADRSRPISARDSHDILCNDGRKNHTCPSTASRKSTVQPKIKGRCERMLRYMRVIYIEAIKKKREEKGKRTSKN